MSKPRKAKPGYTIREMEAETGVPYNTIWNRLQGVRPLYKIGKRGNRYDRDVVLRLLGYTGDLGRPREKEFSTDNRKAERG